MGKFDNKVVIITGSSAGIGQSAAILFSKEGAKVTIHGQNTDRLKQTEQLMIEAGAKPENILIVSGSVENDEVLKNLVEETVKKFGKLDVLINNAGIGQKPGTPPSEMDSMENFNYVMNVNLRAVITLTKLALPYLEKTKGNIVNVSSIGAHKPFPAMLYYTLAKAALDHYTRNCAVMYGKKGIRVNCLNPGAIDTLFGARHGVTEEMHQKFLDNLVNPNTPLGRSAHPDEMGKILLFLASDDASYMTGSIVVADGGNSIFHAGVNLEF
uniref:Uncharacterized protein n=1 Tax=Acrobeloides nanus TaxID=290746 RepID=A0A914EH13_9BILA